MKVDYASWEKSKGCCTARCLGMWDRDFGMGREHLALLHWHTPKEDTFIKTKKVIFWWLLTCRKPPKNAECRASLEGHPGQGKICSKLFSFWSSLTQQIQIAFSKPYWNLTLKIERPFGVWSVFSLRKMLADPPENCIPFQVLREHFCL